MIKKIAECEVSRFILYCTVSVQTGDVLFVTFAYSSLVELFTFMNCNKGNKYWKGYRKLGSNCIYFGTTMGQLFLFTCESLSSITTHLLGINLLI